MAITEDDEVATAKLILMSAAAGEYNSWCLTPGTEYKTLKNNLNLKNEKLRQIIEQK